MAGIVKASSEPCLSCWKPIDSFRPHMALIAFACSAVLDGGSWNLGFLFIIKIIALKILVKDQLMLIDYFMLEIMLG